VYVCLHVCAVGVRGGGCRGRKFKAAGARVIQLQLHLNSVDQPGFNINFYTYFAGDEILAVNGEALQGMSHAEAIAAFKRIRSGPVALRLARRHVLR
jgi:hypothetical protein